MTSLAGISAICIAATTAGAAEAACRTAQPRIVIVDGSQGARLRGATTIAALPASPFKTYTETLTAKASEDAGCDMLELRFVYRPDYDVADRPPAAPATHRFESPWLTIDEHGAERHITFFWDARQMVRDQALLADPKLAALLDRALPDQAGFDRAVAHYAEAVIGNADHAAATRAETAIAPDMLWLLRHAWQSTLAPFDGEAARALRETVRRAGPGYAAVTAKALATALRPGAPKSCRSILDLRDPALIERYRITSLH